MKIVVTGASGQLGQAIRFIAHKYDNVEFVFADAEEGNICDPQQLQLLFSLHEPDYCINAAAYTAVDKAESEPEKAHAINADGPANLALVCKAYNATLLHISTDFIFDGTKHSPYTEEDEPNPQSVYGATKRDGELKIQEILKEHYIIRTSWVYSQFANNFMKTMLRLAAERQSLNVVSDQVGTPTHAVDLAKALMHIVMSGKKAYGIYNYSNQGVASWYDFAKKIFEVNGVSIDLNPIPTSSYPTPAKRPAYSVLDKSKIKEVFDVDIPYWEDSVKPLKQQ